MKQKMISYPTFNKLCVNAKYKEMTAFVNEHYLEICTGDISKSVKVLEMIHRIVNGNYKQLRSETGLSQPKFAHKYGVPVGTINKWENGITKPSEYVYRAIAYIVLTDKLLAD